MLETKNRILEDASNKPTGATAYDLSGTAEAGFVTFASQLANGDQVIVSAEKVDANGNPNGAWELTKCTYTTGTPNTLTRDTLINSSTGSAIDWSGTGEDFTPRLSLVKAGQSDVNSIEIWGGTGTPTTIETPEFIAGHDYLFLLHEIKVSNDNRIIEVQFHDGTSYVTTATSGTGMWGNGVSSSASRNVTDAGVFGLNEAGGLGNAAGEALASQFYLFNPRGSGKTRASCETQFDYYSGGTLAYEEIYWRVDSDEAHVKMRFQLNSTGTFSSGKIICVDLGEGAAL